MTAIDALKACFVETFALDEATDPATLTYQGLPAWDSVGHMALIAAIEARFEIMLETQEILDLSDFPKAVAIIGRHGVEF